MKHTTSKVTWGILFVLFGIFLAGKAIGLFDFNIFFKGWWTLFIIVPSSLGIIKRNHRTFSAIGLTIGFLLLLSTLGVLPWDRFPWVLISMVFLIIGVSLLNKQKFIRYEKDYSYYTNNSYNAGNDNDHENYSSNSTSYNNENDRSDANNNSWNDNSNDDQRTADYNSNYNNNKSNNNTGNNTSRNTDYSNRDKGNRDSNKSSGYNANIKGSSHGNYNNFFALLSSRNVQFVDEVFTGAVITSILGNVQLDIRNAIFKGNVVIDATCILGGIDIYIPSNVKVIFNCTPILAGVENQIITPTNSTGEHYTIYINGTCILSGIEIK